MLAHLLGVELPNPSMIDESVIIVGNDLTPSDTAILNKEFVQVQQILEVVRAIQQL